MRALEAFMVVARSRTLAAAAGDLNLSVSALSRRIQALEAYVGRALFERLYHELRLTEDGEWLLANAEPAFETLSDVLNELGQLHESDLKVGVPPSFAAAWLFPRLPRFRALHSDISLSFDSSGAPFAKIGTSIDAAIVFAEEVAGEYYWRKLRPQAAFAVAAPGLIPTGMTAAAAVREHVLLCHKGLPKVLPLWLEAMSIDEADVSRIEYYDSGPLLVAAAEAGLGVALPLEDSMNFFPVGNRLERPFGEAVETPYSYLFVSKRSALRSRSLKRFHDWLVAEAVA